MDFYIVLGAKFKYEIDFIRHLDVPFSEFFIVLG